MIEHNVPNLLNEHNNEGLTSLFSWQPSGNYLPALGHHDPFNRGICHFHSSDEHKWTGVPTWNGSFPNIFSIDICTFVSKIMAYLIELLSKTDCIWHLVVLCYLSRPEYIQPRHYPPGNLHDFWSNRLWNDSGFCFHEAWVYHKLLASVHVQRTRVPGRNSEDRGVYRVCDCTCGCVSFTLLWGIAWGLLANHWIRAFYLGLFIWSCWACHKWVRRGGPKDRRGEWVSLWYDFMRIVMITPSAWYMVIG